MINTHVAHEHTPVSIPVFMNTKLRIRIFTERPGQGETGHAHLSNKRQLPLMGRSVIPRYSAAQKKSPQIVPKITIFLVFMNKTQILLFAQHATVTTKTPFLARIWLSERHHACPRYPTEREKADTNHPRVPTPPRCRWRALGD